MLAIILKVRRAHGTTCLSVCFMYDNLFVCLSHTHLSLAECEVPHEVLCHLPTKKARRSKLICPVQSQDAQTGRLSVKAHALEPMNHPRCGTGTELPTLGAGQWQAEPLSSTGRFAV